MVYCSALNCQNATSGVYKNSTVTFYGFPLQNKPLLKQWIQNMGRDMGTPSKHQRLCSKHFEDSSFEIDPLKIRKNRRLLKEAVPKKFILGEDGNWLVGTPRSFCGGTNNKTRKRIQNPEHSRVPGTFDNAAAQEGKDLEDWQKELYKKVIKESYESLTTLGCGGAVIRSEFQSHAKSTENTELHGSFSGGSRDLTCQISDKGVTSESHQNSATHQANPTGNRRGNSSFEEGEPNEFKEIFFYQQTHTGERLYLCTECQKTFKLKIGLLKHKQIHTKKNQVSSYICTDCGRNFRRHADLIRHQRTHTGERPYKCTECEKSFMEKARLTNHLRTHNIYT
ncbi:zinc finger protein 436-like isoform X4 [Aquila chrysaetos chrysaetos]|uniref:zinc finger protein 436-like isoform X4 n=1 Tax=Aquila chrysaetos chrysaetos TaxID=223781 RepID=UPI00117678DF|nr:zinc finger protein 436-like isoform X4 [Aquila chrysaetos chrysaetos]